MIAAATALLAASAWASSEFDAKIKSGLAALERGDTMHAELDLRKAAALNPDSADVHAALAVALVISHQRAEALSEYKKALRLERKYVEGLKLSQALRKRGWLRDAPEVWDQEQGNLALEVFNEPAPHEKEAAKLDMRFPVEWVVEGSSARPDMVGSHARLSVSGGKDVFGAQDAADWFDKARAAEPSHYKGYKELELRPETRGGGAAGVRILYTRKHPSFREPLEALDVVLLKGGQYRRAVYEAPRSEFPLHLSIAEKSIDTLKF